MSAAAIAILSLTINFIATISVLHRWGFEAGVSVLFEGDCDKVHKYDTFVHLAINAIGTALLSGSNYCMQVLCAPNREEIDRAHARKEYLDVGVPSARNLKLIAKHKKMWWFVLGLSSVPLHLLYNSVLFGTIATQDYDVYFAREGFLDGQPYNQTSFPDASQVQKEASTWEKLSKKECLSTYAQGILSDRRDLVLVHNNASEGSLSDVYEYSYHLDDTSDDPYAWMCEESLIREKFNALTNSSHVFWNQSGPQPTCRTIKKVLFSHHLEQWTPWDYDIQYCMSEKHQATCRLNYSLSLAIGVMLSNVIKVVAMCYVAFGLTDRPLITVGDAVSSFLEHPDRTTEGACLVSNGYFWRVWNDSSDDMYQLEGGLGERPFRFHHEQKCLREVGHQSTWNVIAFLYFCSLAAIAGFLFVGISK